MRFTDDWIIPIIEKMPGNVKQDTYLSFLALLNQEWNRIQVKFNSN